jgi:hypothetical protein
VGWRSARNEVERAKKKRHHIYFLPFTKTAKAPDSDDIKAGADLGHRQGIWDIDPKRNLL